MLVKIKITAVDTQGTPMEYLTTLWEGEMSNSQLLSFLCKYSTSTIKKLERVLEVTLHDVYIKK